MQGGTCPRCGQFLHEAIRFPTPATIPSGVPSRAGDRVAGRPERDNAAGDSSVMVDPIGEPLEPSLSSDAEMDVTTAAIEAGIARLEGVIAKAQMDLAEAREVLELLRR